jgi:hypothetical protein
MFTQCIRMLSQRSLSLRRLRPSVEKQTPGAIYIANATKAKRKKITFSMLGIAIALFSNCSYAVTECGTTIARVWTGDAGTVWLSLDNGMNAYVVPTDPNVKNILASALTALVTERTIVLRFSADSIPCNGNAGVRGDVVGMWLIK